MAVDSPNDGALVAWYRSRIGVPQNGDEARGYWLFALGAILGVLGMVVFLASDSASTMREASIALSAGGLALVFAGPIIRLPLEDSATWLVYAGLLTCAAAIAWFVAVFPSGWNTNTGEPIIIGLYGLGLLVMAVAGVFVPIVVGRDTDDDAVEDLQTELSATRGDLEQARGDLEEVRGDLEERRGDLAEANNELASVEADEADLAARLETSRDSDSRFEVYEDKGGDWRWRMRHRSGDLLATSGKGFEAQHGAETGMRAVRREASGATVHLFEPEDLPAETETFEPVDTVESKATFEVYEDEGGDWRWRLRHDNDNIIADCGQGYASRSGATSAVEGIREYVGPAEYLWPDPTAFQVYEDEEGQFRWRLLHRNGNILGISAEGYESRPNARGAIESIQQHVGELDVEAYADEGDQFRWRLLDGNDDIIAVSGAGYASKEGVEKAVTRLREYAPEADLLEIGHAAFEIFEDEAGDARWRLRHRNGNIIADSGQGYADRSGAVDGIESVKRNAPNAEQTD